MSMFLIFREEMFRETQKRNAIHYKTGLLFSFLRVSWNEVCYLAYLGTFLPNQSGSQFEKIAQC